MGKSSFHPVRYNITRFLPQVHAYKEGDEYRKHLPNELAFASVRSQKPPQLQAIFLAMDLGTVKLMSPVDWPEKEADIS